MNPDIEYHEFAWVFVFLHFWNFQSRKPICL